MKTKIFLYILAGILVLFVAGIVILHIVLPGKVADSMRKEVAQMMEGEAIGLYQVEIPEVKFSTFFRTMSVSSILLVPDTQALANKEPEALPTEIFSIQAGELEVSTGGLIALVREKDEIVFSNIQLGELSALVIRNPAGDLPENNGDSQALRSLEIKRFALAFSSLKFQTLEALGTDVFSLDQGRFSGGFLWQSDAGPNGVSGEGSDKNPDKGREERQDESPEVNPADGANKGSNENLDEGPEKHQGTMKFDLRDPEFVAAKLNIVLPDGLHRIACDSLDLRGDGGGLELFGMEMIPLFSKAQFKNQVAHQTDRMEARLDTIRFSEFDLNKLINQKYLSVEKLELSNGRLEVFRDRHPPFNTSQRPTMPVKLMVQAPVQMWLGTIQINGLDLFYQELPEGSSEEGVIPFRDLSATLTNLTNAEEHLTQDSLLRIEASARMFGRPSLTASFVYNLRDINGGYSAHGTLASMPFETINPVIYPLTGMRVIEGAHEHTRFSFTGNDFRSDGELTMRYSGLELDLAPDRSQLRQKITNWAGRQFVYHSANPLDNEEVRLGTIDFEREIDRFVFHYWWNSFLTGAGNTVLRDMLN